MNRVEFEYIENRLNHFVDRCHYYMEHEQVTANQHDRLVDLREQAYWIDKHLNEYKESLEISLDHRNILKKLKFVMALIKTLNKFQMPRPQ